MYEYKDTFIYDIIKYNKNTIQYNRFYKVEITKERRKKTKQKTKDKIKR
jgi:hypothetical protein